MRIQAMMDLVDRPTQLICIWIFIWQQTNTKDIAGQSAKKKVPEQTAGSVWL